MTDLRTVGFTAEHIAALEAYSKNKTVSTVISGYVGWMSGISPHDRQAIANEMIRRKRKFLPAQVLRRAVETSRSSRG